MACDHTDSCGFFNKFHNRESLIWKAMVKQHCVDGEDCTRRVMFNAGQTPPSDDLMPVGVHASRGFLSMP